LIDYACVEGSVAEHRQLAHPPLREALIDLRLSEELPDSFLNRAAGHKLSGYDTVTKILRGSLALQMTKPEEPPVTKVASEQFGWRYDAGDGSRVAQLRRDGMTYSVVKGYTKWEDARFSAQQLWRHYIEWGSPKSVSRLAVRYINVLQVPTGVDLDAYLTAGPRIPPGLPQIHNSFLHRVVIPFAPTTTAIVTQVLESMLESSASVVLDIDVFMNGSFSPDSAEIWTELDNLRIIKNQIFFAALTEKALEAYQ
jgi:uncharacterized protein (TIGR04255 family)